MNVWAPRATRDATCACAAPACIRERLCYALCVRRSTQPCCLVRVRRVANMVANRITKTTFWGYGTHNLQTYTTTRGRAYTGRRAQTPD